MKRQVLKLELITPGFLGGATPSGPAEWRGSSIRGHLRFWFRAVAGGRLQGDLAEVNRLEAEVFGSTKRASALIVRTTGQPASQATGISIPMSAWRAAELAALWNDDPIEAPLPRLHLGPANDEIRSRPIAYLGYGVIDHHGSTTRPSFREGASLDVEIVWRHPISTDNDKLLDDALWAWLHLGGIGARSRRGFGSIQCVPSDGDPASGGSGAAEASFKARARSLLQDAKLTTDEPRWTHFSDKSRILIGASGPTSALEALQQVGAWLMSYRRRYGASCDKRTMPDGTPVSGRDYEWAKLAGAAGANHLPDRVGFGLPLPFAKQRSKVGVPASGNDLPSDPRRASPLLARVLKLGPRDFRPVLTYLPAQLIADGTRLALFRTDSQARVTRPLTRGAIESPTSTATEIPDRFVDAIVAANLVQEVQ